MSDRKRVLFVCHGNICRSPMAEFIMKDIVKRNGASDRYVIDSCATSAEALGQDMYPPAKAKLKEKGIPFEKRSARRMTSDMYDDYDVIAVMDMNNQTNIAPYVNGDPQYKVKMLMQYTGAFKGIDDPWYTDDFETAYNEITEGCLALYDYLEGSI